MSIYDESDAKALASLPREERKRILGALATPLKDLPLPKRVANAFALASMRTLRDVVAKDPTRVRRVGAATLVETKALVDRLLELVRAPRHRERPFYGIVNTVSPAA